MKAKNLNCKWCKVCLRKIDEGEELIDGNICINCANIKQPQIYWCKDCNDLVKTHEATCPYCRSKLKLLAKDVRPVFSRERKILQYLKIIDNYQLKNSKIWRNAKQQYYYIDGNKVLLPSYQELFRFFPELIAYIKSEDNYEIIDNSLIEHYYKTAKMNENYIRILEGNAFNFLNQLANEEYKDLPLVVSFSGGKDSTVIADLVKKCLGLVHMDLIFNNTTLEQPQTLEYIKKFASIHELSLVEAIDQNAYSSRGNYLYQVTPRNNFTQLVKQIGPPARGVRWCCSIFKASGINECMQAWGNRVLTIYGIRNSESVMRSHYCPVTEQAKIGMQVTASPVISWLDFDIWMYIFKHRLMFNDLYRYGYSRVGCWLCPMNSTWSDFLNQIHFPSKSSNWRDYLISYAKELGKPDPEEYVDSGNWKKRFGGAGRSNSYEGIESRPCGARENTIQYNLRKSVDNSIYEYFKPFGKLNFYKGREALGEFYIEPKNIFKKQVGELMVEAIQGSDLIRVTFINPQNMVLAGAYVKNQVVKFEMCIQCTACNIACPHGAISVTPPVLDSDFGYKIDETNCWQHECINCVKRFDSHGCLVAKSLFSNKERKVL